VRLHIHRCEVWWLGGNLAVETTTLSMLSARAASVGSTEDLAKNNQRRALRNSHDGRPLLLFDGDKKGPPERLTGHLKLNGAIITFAGGIAKMAETTVRKRMADWKRAFSRELNEVVAMLELGDEPPQIIDVDTAAVRMVNSTGWWPARVPQEEQAKEKHHV
jgi:hypothetical protein